MTEHQTRNFFWSYIGKLAGLLSVIWIGIQLYNYFFKDSYRIKALGSNYSFDLPSNIIRDLSDYNKLISIDSALRIDKPQSQFNSLIEFRKYPDYKWEKYNILGIYNRNKGNYLNYKNIWKFEIKNRGRKPIEDLKLELPFDGYYRITKQNEPTLNGSFSKQILLDNLQPSYVITMLVWAPESYTSIPEYDEEKTRLTHKYGWTKISYSREVRGIVAWNLKKDGMPIFFGIMFLIVILISIFVAGMNYYPIYQEQERKRKLEELNEMQRLKAEEEARQQNTTEDKK